MNAPLDDVLADVPPPAPRRLAVRVTNDALRQIRGGHPWVFDQSIVSVNADDAAPGDLAVVFDNDRAFAAIGLYDPSSPIRIRVLHHGRPTTIDRAWFEQRLATAFDRRAPIIELGDTTGLRLVHGENDGLPGLVVDRFADVIVIKLYTNAWIPHLATIASIIVEILAPRAVVLRLGRETAASQTHGLRDGMTIAGVAPTEPVRFIEHGLHFEADVVRGQKTGHFLDQRDNRAKVRALAGGARVLDVFCCTGGFSVYAAAGGASSVHSVDLSAPALAATQRNRAHNAFITNVRECRHSTEAGDAFDVMRALAQQKRTFDVVVVDPPSFARRAHERDRAVAAYRRLTRLALALLDDGGALVQSSCSSRVPADDFFDAIHAEAAATSSRLTEMVRTTHALDHPIGFPEGAYLKTMFARVHRQNRS